jgi:hypothetical protein
LHAKALHIDRKLKARLNGQDVTTMANAMRYSSEESNRASRADCNFAFEFKRALNSRFMFHRNAAHFYE